jgi:hypothetical protein
MTSIEWLVDQLKLTHKEAYNDLYEVIQQAKEMHKQEIIDAWSDGAVGGQFTTTPDTPEQYYQETFKQPKKIQ